MNYGVPLSRLQAATSLLAHGKEGVTGSSPVEGFTGGAANAAFLRSKALAVRANACAYGSVMEACSRRSWCS